MIISERREHPSQISIVLIFGICLTISFGSMLTFGLNSEAGNSFGASVNAMIAVLLFVLHLLFTSSERFTYFLRLPPSFTTHRLAIFYCFVSFAVSSILLLNRLEQHGQNQVNLYSVTFWLVVIFFVLLYLVLIAIQRPGFPSTVLLVSLASYLVLTYFHLSSIGLEADNRQPFNLYYEAIDRFFIGLDPYQVYDTAGDRPFTVLPGHWLSYIAFRFLKLDPRWLGVFAQVTSVILVYLAVPKQRKHLAAYLLSLYILLPYHNSVESYYTGLLPLLISLIFFLFAKDLFLLGVAALGWSLSLSLFSWLLIPFAMGYLFHKQPRRYWAVYLLIAGLFAAMQLLPFGLEFQATFFYCTVNYWFDTFYWNGFNISFWLAPLIGGYGLYFLQAFFFIVLFTHYVKSDKTLSSSFIYCSTYALFFLITNRVVETYLFPLILLQAIMGFAVAGDNRATIAPIRIHKSPTQSTGTS